MTRTKVVSLDRRDQSTIENLRSKDLKLIRTSLTLELALRFESLDKLNKKKELVVFWVWALGSTSLDASDVREQ